MEPDLSRRVEIALHHIRTLGTPAAEDYLHALRQSDPEVAGRLAALIDRTTPGGLGGPAAGATVSHSASGESLHTATWPRAGSAVGADPPPAVGRLQPVRVLGRGAFGEVWQAYDPVLQKHVAVKVQIPSASGRPRDPAAALDEARKAASLRHPAVVQVYDVAAGAGGWYVVSEFIDGESLRDRMAAGRVPFDQAARAVATVAGGLHAAHLAGLVHRDVKPANILLDRAGNAYLTDFGLAVREDEQAAERSRVAGTLAYMAPEQILGNTHLMDGRADVYALGAVLYELLTGRPLVRATGLDDYREQILRREPRPPRVVDPTVPPELERICLRCLAKEVRDRYPTAADLAADLTAWLAGPAARPPAPGRTTAALAAAGLACLLAGTATVAVFVGRPDRERTTASTPPPAPAKVPVVRELVWPRDRPQCKWEVLPETNQLRVYTDATGLLQLGEAPADDWELSVTVRQLASVGRVGAFVGHRPDPRSTTAAFEVVRVEVIDGRPYLQRAVETYRLDTAFAGTNPRVFASVPLKDLAPENTLRLIVRGGLTAVWFNGESVPGLFDTPYPSPPARGGFGVYNRFSDGTFSNLTLDARSIPLLADPP